VNVLCSETTQGDFDYFTQGGICQPEVNLVSKWACPVFSTSQMWEYLYMYRYYWGGPLIFIGLLLCFLGRYLIKPSICIAGFITAVFLSMLIYYAIYLQQASQLSTFWWFLGGGAVLGLILGIVLACFAKVGAALLAGWGGFALGMMLMSSVFSWTGSQILFWVIVCACALISAILAFFIFDRAVIVATAGLGSYAAVRGVSLYAGHYYNEFMLAQMIKNGLISQIDPYYWLYVAGMFILLILGLVAQCCMLKRENRAKINKKDAMAWAEKCNSVPDEQINYSNRMS
jgi:hypothetical protein